MEVGKILSMSSGDGQDSFPFGNSDANWRRPLKRKGGAPLNAKTILKLLSNPKMRRMLIRLLKSRTVRRIIISQVKRRMRHR